MTEISRMKLDHPDLNTAGGAGLHTSINNMFTKIGDNSNSRFFTSDGLANAASVNFDHNFKTAFSELSYNLYLRNTGTGELTLITETSTPSIYQFSLVARSSFETTQVTLTNNSGSSRDVALVLSQNTFDTFEKFNATISNNQSVATDLIGLLLDSTKYVGAIINYKIERITDSFKTYAIGTLKVLFRSDLNDWIIFRDENYDDGYSATGIIFSVLSSGQIQYTSSNVAGTGYVGTFNCRTTKIFI